MMNNEYETLLTSLRGLLMDEHDEIANMANAAALLYQYLSLIHISEPTRH